MHIPPMTTRNRPIVDIDDDVPLNYFNIVKLKHGDAFRLSTVPSYETGIVPAHRHDRRRDRGRATSKPSGAPRVESGTASPRASMSRSGAKARVSVSSDDGGDLRCRCALREDSRAIRRARARHRQRPIRLRRHQDPPQDQAYSRTRNRPDASGGCWSLNYSRSAKAAGPAFRRTSMISDRPPIETRHDETYNFRFRPETRIRPATSCNARTGGSDEAYHVVDGSTLMIDRRLITPASSRPAMRCITSPSLGD